MTKTFLKIAFQLIWIPIFIWANVFVLDAQDFGYRKAEDINALSGSVKTISLFVDSEDECWSEEERDFYINELSKGQGWINNQAKKYDHEIYWENDYFDVNNEIIYLSKYHRFGPRLMLLGAAEALGLPKMDDIVKQCDIQITNEKIKLIFFIKSSDRSMSINFWSSKKLDVAVINCRSTYGMITDYYTIAHELLHQFGAWDLYYGMSQSKEKAEEISGLFPHSIMINTHINKDELVVDQLTASLVGWSAKDSYYIERFKPVWENPYLKKSAKTLLSP